MKLTKSQLASAWAVVVGAAAMAVQYSPQIQAALPGSKWVGPALGFASLLVAANARALNSRNSGIGSGIVNAGPDVRAILTIAQGLESGAAGAIVPGTSPGASHGTSDGIQG